MENLDLDINNYNINDLEKFFRLKPHSKYTASDVELKEYEIREQLLKSGYVNKRFKRDLIEFLNIAKEWLIFVKCSSKTPPSQPTSIPKNWKLDNIDTPLSKEPLSRTEELINRPDTEYIYTNNSDFLPGTINPLKTRIITKCLNIDTRFRDNIYTTQSSDFIIQLPTKINKVVSMQLASIELPVSFYCISSSLGNNFLNISVNYNSFNFSNEVIIEDIKLVVPDGNYNANDFVDTINGLLCPLTEDNNPLYPDNVSSYIQLSLDIKASGSGTGKVTIQTTGDKAEFINFFNMDFTKDIMGVPDTINLSSKIGWNLGFIKPQYNFCNAYIAESVVEPANIRYLYLSIDDYNNSFNNHFLSVYNNSMMNPNILARISLKGSYFTLIMENDYNIISEPRIYFGPVDIQKLRIRLFDEQGRILPMNNSNFSFCLNLKTVYDL
jgi:hypothetical protein